MKAAGINKIWVGAESPDPDVLRAYSKECNLKYCDQKEMRRIINKAHKRGIQVYGFFMNGSPVETVKSIRMLPDYIKKAGFDGGNVNCFTLFPGAELTEDLIARGIYKPKIEDLPNLTFKVPAPIEIAMGVDVFISERARLNKELYNIERFFGRATPAFVRSVIHRNPRSIRKTFGTTFASEFGFTVMHREKGLDELNKVIDFLDERKRKKSEPTTIYSAN